MYYLVIILNAYCIYHIWKNGSERYWFYVVLFLPVVGGLVYLFTHVFRKSSINNIQEGLTQVVNPSSAVTKLEKKLEFSDTFQNRIELADAYLANKMYQRAYETYQVCLQGPFADDEHLLMKLCQTYFQLEEYQKVVDTAKAVEDLKEFQNMGLPLAQALSYDRLDDVENAKRIFEKYNNNYSNYPLRVNYAQFLERQGDVDGAVALLLYLEKEFSNMRRSEKAGLRQWENQIKANLTRLKNPNQHNAG